MFVFIYIYIEKMNYLYIIIYLIDSQMQDISSLEYLCFVFFLLGHDDDLLRTKDLLVVIEKSVSSKLPCRDG